MSSPPLRSNGVQFPDGTKCVTGTPSFTGYATGRAYFNNSAVAALTWSIPFPSAVYNVIPGTAIVTDGGGSVAVSGDSTSQTTTGMNINSNTAFTGYVDVEANL